MGGENKNSARIQNSPNSAIIQDSPNTNIVLGSEDYLLRQYSHIASMLPVGATFYAGDGLTNNNELLKGTYEEKGSQIFFKCDNDSITTYKKVIVGVPNFPFSYYALAICKERLNESDWIDYAKKAIKIFEITIQIPNHAMEHEEALKILKEKLI